MIDVKDAVKKSIEYFRDLTGDKNSRILVEEVEFDKENDQWKITIGIPDPNAYMFPGQQKDYKVMLVNASNGEVMGMKIRNLQS